MKEKKVNIVLFGQMRAGKDTVTNYIKEKYNYMDFKFSHGISCIIKEYFPNYMQEVKQRELYQKIGQGLRELYSNIWIDKTFKDIYNYNRMSDYGPATAKSIIITDGRQVNEAEACRKRGYIIIKVVADKATRVARMNQEKDNYTPHSLIHETELAVENIEADYTITNNGTLEQLHKQIDTILVELGVTVE